MACSTTIWAGAACCGAASCRLLLVIFVRSFVKEPKVWVENRRLQRLHNREVGAPLFKIFQRGMLANTLTACWWMASSFVVYYSIFALFATHLQKDLHFSAAPVPIPDRCRGGAQRDLLAAPQPGDEG